MTTKLAEAQLTLLAKESAFSGRDCPSCACRQLDQSHRTNLQQCQLQWMGRPATRTESRPDVQGLKHWIAKRRSSRGPPTLQASEYRRIGSMPLHKLPWKSQRQQWQYLVLLGQQEVSQAPTCTKKGSTGFQSFGRQSRQQAS